MTGEFILNKAKERRVLQLKWFVSAFTPNIPEFHSFILTAQTYCILEKL